MQIDEKGLAAAIDAIWRQWKLPEEERLNGATTAPALAHAAISAYLESAKPKEADRLKELAATCPTIQKAGRKLAADRVSGKVVVGCYGDVPAVEFKRLAAMLSAAGGSNDR